MPQGSAAVVLGRQTVNVRLLQIAVAWLVSVGVGCTSAPVRYYTLTAPPDKALSASETTLVIDVRIVHTPPSTQSSRADGSYRAERGDAPGE